MADVAESDLRAAGGVVRFREVLLCKDLAGGDVQHEDGN